MRVILDTIVFHPLEAGEGEISIRYTYTDEFVNYKQLRCALVKDVRQCTGLEEILTEILNRTLPAIRQAS